MKKTLNQLVPQPLRHANEQNLLNNRLLWASQVPYVLFFCLLFGAVGTTLLYMSPVSASALPSSPVVFVVALLFMAVPFGFWVYKQSAYQIVRNGSLAGIMKEQVIFFTYLLACVAFFSVPYWIGFETERRVASVVSEEEMKADAEVLNLGYAFISMKQSLDNYARQNKVMPSDEVLHLNVFSHQYYAYSTAPYDGNAKDPLWETFKNINTLEEKVATLRRFLTVAKKYGANYALVAEQEESSFNSTLSLDNPNQKELIALSKENKSLFDSELGINPAMMLLLMQQNVQPLTSYEWDSQRHKIIDNMSTISKARNDPYFADNVMLTVYSLFIFGSGILIWILQHAGLFHFLRGVFGLMIAVGATAAFGATLSTLSMFEEEALLAFIGAFYAFAFYMGIKADKLGKFSHVASIGLIMAAITSPLIVLWACSLVNSNLTESEAMAAIWVGILAAAFIVLPLLRKSFLSLYAQPKSA
ncbi:MAG: hypothetical protein EAZ57_00235 [Cytophagales bacterium]|nr:MAG: hypothetical protein EAZ67_13745 [Cytophagales bacterium]TAF62443.1 MAG: hypothetical protein EAZ57_00235 [Cytophagales bacterium]